MGFNIRSELQLYDTDVREHMTASIEMPVQHDYE